ncbi:MAG: LPS assembly lipoprotein LptE [Verrucomicrobiota bacterium]|nr:LPS assembly lipoprotein LptE [Verrucomicrobiota bacterium]
MKALVVACLLAGSLAGCAGYRIGEVKPRYLTEIHSIAVPTFTNKTYLPRIEVLLTDTVIKQLQQDGTFQIVSEGKADAVLKAEIRGVGRNPARSVRGNVLATTEFNLNITVRYTLTTRDGKVIVGPVDVSGTTSFFVGSDVATDQRQALPLAAEDVAVHLTSQLSEGW